MAQKFDAIVIGTGQAGPSVVARMSSEGMKVAVIERKLFGGTCVNVGCIPTKTLVASARAAFMVSRASEFGIKIEGPISVDMKKVKARKDAVVAESNTGVTKWLEGLENVTVFRGHAEFSSAKEIVINDQTLTAEKIIINVGGRLFVPDMPGIKDVNYLTSSGMMELDFLPEHLIIIGGSYIGLEFAQMYRRFGSTVTVIERSDRIISREDEDVSLAVTEFLEKEGIEIRTNADCIEFKKEGDGVLVGVKCDGPEKTIQGSHLLIAVGRVPNTDSLGLGKTEIKTDSRGFIEVNDTLQTNVEGVWALGDVNRKGAFTHTSYNDHEILVANMFDQDERKVSDRIDCYGLFVDPPLARIGMSETQARESGRKVLMGKRLMSRVGRARERSETYGFIKILVDADSKEILGATILGVNGDEAIHCLLDVMYAKAPYTVIQRAVHIHPTVAELIPTVLGSLRPL